MGTRKIAILTHDIEGGAFANLATSLALGFQQLDSDCDVVVLNASEESKQRYPNVKVVSLGASRTIFALPQIGRYIREQSPDVIFPMPWYFNVVAIWARFLAHTQTKIVIGEHNICSLEASVEHQHNFRIRYLLPVLMRYTYPHGDGLIGVSQDTITDLINEMKIPLSIPLRAIANPIDPDRIQRLAAEPLAHPWFQDASVPVIVTVARLAKQKQLDVLLRAFAQVVQTTPAKLLILGEGPLRAELENLCRDLAIQSQVAMPGFDRNPYRFMASCGVFVLASAWEGCPIALQEALACGAAVIVNDAPGGSKDVVDYGKYGMMVPDGNVDALAQGMIQILTQPDLQLHYQHQARLRSRDFQYLNVCKQYLDFYELVRQEDCLA